MTRNQKIALGCGGAGCLGLLVVVIAGGLIYFFAYREVQRRASDFNSNYNFNLNTNSNANSNDNSDSNSNDDSNSNSDSSGPSSSLSDDDQHKLFHAASVTGDAELIQRVNNKLGLLDNDFTPGDKYHRFAVDHVTWAFRNTDFIQQINTAEKARDYVNDNIPQ